MDKQLEGQMSIFDFITEPKKELTPAQEYYAATGKNTYWQDSSDKPYQWYVDDYIKENPTCFYVLGHYLDRQKGWHKMPEELPTFSTWRLIDVVLFGKKTGTAWMEIEKWQAQYWAFRSIDDRRNTETTEVLAWRLSEDEEAADE